MPVGPSTTLTELLSPVQQLPDEGKIRLIRVFAGNLDEAEEISPLVPLDEWGDEFSPVHAVELVRCAEGILVKPLPKTPIQVALERKLPMNRPTHLDLADMDMDTLGW